MHKQWGSAKLKKKKTWFLCVLPFASLYSFAFLKTEEDLILSYV